MVREYQIVGMVAIRVYLNGVMLNEDDGFGNSI
jgi:predicted acetyltransferase